MRRRTKALSQERLGRMLAAQKIKANQTKLAERGDMQAWRRAAAQQMADRIPIIAHQHRVRQAMPRLDLAEKDGLDRLRKLADGLMMALQAVDVEPSSLSLGDEADQQIRTLRSLQPLHAYANRILKALSFDRLNSLKSKQRIPTALFLDLFELYRQITGRTGLGGANGEGPLCRFTKECAALVDAELKCPDPGAFRKLMWENTQAKV